MTIQEENMHKCLDELLETINKYNFQQNEAITIPFWLLHICVEDVIAQNKHQSALIIDKVQKSFDKLMENVTASASSRT